MKLLFALLMLSALHASGFLSAFAAGLSPRLHALCLSMLPTPSFHPLHSLICGASVEDAELKRLLRQTGLLHLFVVSGAHLIWLDHFLSRIKAPFLFRVAGWTLFSLACGWQPPVVRGWVGLLLSRLSPRWTPRPRADQHALLTGLITLTLFPVWGGSLSLALSWVAAFSLSLPGPRGWKGELVKCASVWFFLLPLLAPWSPASPLTILVNLLLTPVFSLLLLPLGAFCLLVPPALPLFDSLFSVFVRVLSVIPVSAPGPVGDVPVPALMWAWVLFLQVGAHLALTPVKRRGS